MKEIHGFTFRFDNCDYGYELSYKQIDFLSRSKDLDELVANCFTIASYSKEVKIHGNIYTNFYSENGYLMFQIINTKN